MSKKKNKKSAKKKVSKKPANLPAKGGAKQRQAGKKNAAKKSARKAPKAKKKAAPKKGKKVVKKVKKVVKKKVVKKNVVKKAAPKKAIKNPVKKATAKPAAKPVKILKPAKPSPVKIVKPEAKAQAVKAKPEVKAEPAQEEPKVVRIVKPMPKGEPIPNGKKSLVIDIKTGPEPAGKFELEYVVHASSQILFEFLTTPSGLSEWFCDDVNIRNGVYSFKWEENEQNARVVKLIEDKLIRYQWLDKHDNSYFEFRLERDELTNDISLIISDFAETPEEKNSSVLLWNSQVDKLLHVLGAYF